MDKWNVEGWHFKEFADGVYSRHFTKENVFRKVCILHEKRLENLIIITALRPRHKPTVDPIVDLYPKNRLFSVTKEDAIREVSLQKELACRCIQKSGKSLTPLVYESVVLEKINPSDYGILVYHESETQIDPSYKKASDIERYYKELTEVDLFMIDMEYVNGNEINNLLGKNHKAVFKACRSLVYHAYTLGILYLDFHLPNFIMKRTAHGVQSYLLDFGSTRLLTENEQLSMKSHSEDDGLQYIIEECRKKSPHIFSKRDNGKGYQWFWNDRSSDEPFSSKVESNLSLLPWITLTSPMPPSQCTYHKTATHVCSVLSFLKTGGTKKKLKKKRKSTFYKERKQRAVSVALSPYRLF